jgi:hypothetical protein
MSRSNPNTRTTIVHKRFEWSGDKGVIKHYNAATKSTEEVKFPFTFLVLDELNTVGGYSDADRSGYWANDVRSTKKDILTVRTKKGEQFSGTYDELKNKMGQFPGIKYAKHIYIAYKDSGELVIGALKLLGAGVSAWIDFTKDLEKGELESKAVVVIGKSELLKKGKTEYYKPLFQLTTVSEETNTDAIELDKQLQAWLNGNNVMNTPVAEPTDEEEVPELSEPPIPGDEGSDLPF